MSSSTSSPTNTTQTQTSASETNYSIAGGAGGIQGINLLGNQGTTLTYSPSVIDAGAVQAGTDTANHALTANEHVVVNALDYAKASQESNTHLLTDILTGASTQLANYEHSLSDIGASTASTLQAVASAQATPPGAQQADFAKSVLIIFGVVAGIGIIAWAYSK